MYLHHHGSKLEAQMAIFLTRDLRPTSPLSDAVEAERALRYLVQDLRRRLDDTTSDESFDRDAAAQLLGDAALTAAAYQQSLISQEA